MEILPSLLGFISSRVKVLKHNVSDLIDNPAEASQNLAHKMLHDLAVGLYAMGGTTPEESKEWGKKSAEARKNGTPLPPLNIGEMASKSTLGAGTLIGREAKLFNAEAERTARKMEGLGNDRGYIQEQTGTWLGHPDKLARQEISDAKSLIRRDQLVTDANAERFSPSEMAQFSKEGMKLGDILDHPELFKNYPDLKNIDIMYGHGTKERTGRYDPRDDSIIALGKDPDEALSTLIHEIQHAVQQREKWGSGASMEAVPFDKRTSQLYQDKLMELKRNPDVDWADKENLRSIDKLLRYDLYKRTAGEADARLAQTRAGFTDEELRQFPIEDFYDIPLKEMLLGSYK